MSEVYKGVNAIAASDEKEWREWLRKNHTTEKSVWLIIFHKDAAVRSVYYPQAVDQALCFGWVDSKPAKRDQDSYYVYFSRRNPRSNWSKVNKEKVLQLMEKGLMEKAGVDMVETAKTSGTWDALNEVEAGVLPEYMQSLLEQTEPALRHWNNFPPSVRRGILEWICNARKDSTREDRIKKTVEMARKNKRILFDK